MESWQRVFHDGFARVMSLSALEALKNGLENDDFSLIQGATTSPPPLMSTSDWPVDAACAIGYAGWKGDAKEMKNVTVGQVEEYFAEMCFETDLLLGEPAACRLFLNWFDETPRETMRKQLLNEINIVLESRTKVAA